MAWRQIKYKHRSVFFTGDFSNVNLFTGYTQFANNFQVMSVARSTEHINKNNLLEYT